MIEIIVNDRLGKKIRVKCNPDDTVGDLKILLSAQIGTRADKIRLQKWYTVYKDHIKLKDYEIQDVSSNHDMSVNPKKEDSSIFVDVTFDYPLTNNAIYLHWGITLMERPGIWIPPDKDIFDTYSMVLPPNTYISSGSAQTPFEYDGKLQLHTMRFTFSNLEDDRHTHLPCSIDFVLLISPNTWKKNGKLNFSIPVKKFFDNITTEKFFVKNLENLLPSVLKEYKLSSYSKIFWNLHDESNSFSLLALVCSGTLFVLNINDFIGSIGHPDYQIIYFIANTSHPIILHWGFENKSSWKAPELWGILGSLQDENIEHTLLNFKTVQWNSDSLLSPFEFYFHADGSYFQYLSLIIKPEVIVSNTLKFRVKELYSNICYMNKGKDLYIDLTLNENQKSIKKAYDLDQLIRIKEETNSMSQLKVEWETALNTFQLLRNDTRISQFLLYETFTLTENAGELEVIIRSESSHTLKIYFFLCSQQNMVLRWGILNGRFYSPQLGSIKWISPSLYPCCYNSHNKYFHNYCEIPFQPLVENHDELKLDPLYQYDKFFFMASIEIPCKFNSPKTHSGTGIYCDFDSIGFMLKDHRNNVYKNYLDNSEFIIHLTSKPYWNEVLSNVADEILRVEMGPQNMTYIQRYKSMNSIISEWAQNNRSVSRIGTDEISEKWMSIFRPLLRRRTSTYFNSKYIRLKSKDTVLKKKGEIESSNYDFWTWMFVWSCFSHLGLLDWQRYYNKKNRELCQTMNSFTLRLSEIWIEWPQYRFWIRLILSTFLHGENFNKTISDSLLKIMHTYKIPEHPDNFFEQWYQKLHLEVTPHDIYICEAIILYYQNDNDILKFWDSLKNNNMTEEDLLGLAYPISAIPHQMHQNTKQLICDVMEFENLLKTQENVMNINRKFKESSPYLDKRAFEGLEKIVNPTIDIDNTKDNLTLIFKTRQKLIFLLNRETISATGARHIIYLDLLLEHKQRCLMDSTDSIYTIEFLIDIIVELLIQISGHDPYNIAFFSMATDWISLKNDIYQKCAQDEYDYYLILQSFWNRIYYNVNNVSTYFYFLLTPKADLIAYELNISKKIVNDFLYEILHKSIYGYLNKCVQYLGNLLLEKVQFPPWRIINLTIKTYGFLRKVSSLDEIKECNIPSIIICDRFLETDIIPTGVQGLIIPCVKEHLNESTNIFIQALSARVFIAFCYNKKYLMNMDHIVGQWIEVSIGSDSPILQVSQLNHLKCLSSSNIDCQQLRNVFDRRIVQKKIYDHIVQSNCTYYPSISMTPLVGKWILSNDEYFKIKNEEFIINLNTLQQHIPSSVTIPNTCVLPDGCLSRVLLNSLNKDTYTELDELMKKTMHCSDFNELQYILISIRQLFHILQCPEDLILELKHLCEFYNHHLHNYNDLDCVEGIGIEKMLSICSEDQETQKKNRKSSLVLDDKRNPAFQRRLSFALDDRNRNANDKNYNINVNYTDNVFEDREDIQNINTKRLATEVRKYLTTDKFNVNDITSKSMEDNLWNTILYAWGLLSLTKTWFLISNLHKENLILDISLLFQDLPTVLYSFVVYSDPLIQNDYNKRSLFGNLFVGLDALVTKKNSELPLWWEICDDGTPKIISYLSKNTAIFNNPSILCNSIFHTKPLNTISTEHLISSFVSKPTSCINISYMETKILSNSSFRYSLLTDINNVSLSIINLIGKRIKIKGYISKNYKISISQISLSPASCI